MDQSTISARYFEGYDLTLDELIQIAHMLYSAYEKGETIGLSQKKMDNFLREVQDLYEATVILEKCLNIRVGR